MEEIAALTRYVDASLELHDLRLTADQRQRVIDTFVRNAAIVAPVLDFELPAEVEPATIFKA